MTGLASGLCSVTFRDLGAQEVVALASRAGLDCIEWGGDLHVPHGDVNAAARVAELTSAAGMFVCSYGSYLFADENASAATEEVLDTADALDAPAVRIWAPFGIDPGCTSEQRSRVASVLREIAAAADDRGLLVYLEFHDATLTANARSAVELLDAVEADNLLCGWQPAYWDPRPLHAELGDLTRLAPYLAHLHVYSWSTGEHREPLDAHGDRWPTRLATASAIPAVEGLRRAALLEFVAGDSPAQFSADAAQLVSWLAEVVGEPRWHPSAQDRSAGSSQ